MLHVFCTNLIKVEKVWPARISWRLSFWDERSTVHSAASHALQFLGRNWKCRNLKGTIVFFNNKRLFLVHIHRNTTAPCSEPLTTTELLASLVVCATTLPVLNKLEQLQQGLTWATLLNIGAPAKNTASVEPLLVHPNLDGHTNSPSVSGIDIRHTQPRALIACQLLCRPRLRAGSRLARATP